MWLWAKLLGASPRATAENFLGAMLHATREHVLTGNNCVGLESWNNTNHCQKQGDANAIVASWTHPEITTSPRLMFQGPRYPWLKSLGLREIAAPRQMHCKESRSRSINGNSTRVSEDLPAMKSLERGLICVAHTPIST